MGMRRSAEVGGVGTWDRTSGGILADVAQMCWNFSAQIASTTGDRDFALDNRRKLINTVITLELIKHA